MSVQLAGLVREIGRIHAAAGDRGRAEARIEEYLQRQLRNLDEEERQQLLAALEQAFAPAGGGGLQGESLARFCSLLLGRELTPADISSEEMMARLARALETVLESLNELVLTINTTLLDEGADGETIHHLIGRELGGGQAGVSLDEYVGRIKTAFLVSHQAFRLAAQEMAGTMLERLDPDRLGGGTGFRFGPMKKAEAWERYRQAFTNCKKWYDSGRCLEEFLREFEKQCRLLVQNNRATVSRPAGPDQGRHATGPGSAFTNPDQGGIP